MTSPKRYRNVCDVITANDYCIGCGICAGICPALVLEMKFNRFGQYQPVEISEKCLTRCNLCLRACPFWTQEDNEDTLAARVFGDQSMIKHTAETGYYLNSFVGYSKVGGHRDNGASGGLATWLLETLLNQKIVDNVICVVSNPDPGKLYKFSVLNSMDEIRNASKSCYYPVELSEVIDYVNKHEGRYAITGLPCFLKGLRLAMRDNRRLKERLVFLVGLVCGQMQSKYFAEYLCTLKGGDPKFLKEVTFRIKDPQRHASDFGFEFKCSDENETRGEIFWNSGMGEVWQDGYFTPNPCYYCDDIFAEVADIVFMDAWLPEYRSRTKGTNLLVVRSQQINELLENDVLLNQIELNRIDIRKAIDSQGGVIRKKRKELVYRLMAQNSQLEYCPQKRFIKEKPLRIDEKIIIYFKNRVRKQGRVFFFTNKGKKIVNCKLIFYKSILRLFSKSLFLLSTMRHSFINVLEDDGKRS
jgi:coenzyme F420 hydrogenase subunit beta